MISLFFSKGNWMSDSGGAKDCLQTLFRTLRSGHFVPDIAFRTLFRTSFRTLFRTFFSGHCSGTTLWWRDLDLGNAIQHLRTTFVQVPDRLHGALSNARGKLLEVHDAAMSRGDSAAELKALLLFDSLMLAHGRNQSTCADELEERLPWFWGGQWTALWCSSTGNTAPPAATRSKNDDENRVRPVNTIAGSDE